MNFQKLTKIIIFITIASIFLGGCSSDNTVAQQTQSSNTENGTIKIASKPMTEQFILSEWSFTTTVWHCFCRRE